MAQSLHAQWDSLVLPGQDRIFQTFVSGGRLFTLSGTYGLYESKDAGISWQKQPTPGTFGPQIGGFKNRWECAVYGNHIYLENYNGLAQTFRLFRSNDAGNSWEELDASGTMLSNRQAWIAFEGGLLVYSEQKLYRRSHTASNWEIVNGPAVLGAYLAADGNTIWLGTGPFNQGVFRSTDGANTWQTVNSIANAYYLSVRGDTLFTGNENGLFRSLNGGQSWQNLQSGYLYNVRIFSSAGGHFMLKQSLVSYPSDTIWFSNDAFNTRTLVYSGPGAGLEVTDIMAYQGHFLLGTTDVLLRRAANTSKWFVSSYGIPSLGASTTSLEAYPDSILIIRPNINYNNSLFSLNLGKTWQVSTQATTIRSILKKEDWYYVEAEYDLYRTKGDFDQMEKIIAGNINPASRLALVGSTLVATTFNTNQTPAIWYSNDNGFNWQTNQFQIPTDLRGIGITEDRIYAYRPAKHEAVYTTDFGATWKSMGRLGIFPGQYLRGADQIGNTLFLGTDRGVYASTDAGQNWTEHSFNWAYYYRGANASGILLQDPSSLKFSPDLGQTLIDIKPINATVNDLYYRGALRWKDHFLFVDGQNRIWISKNLSSSIKQASGTVYQDTNNNGQLEGNETGISGALVVLNNLGAAVSADANGKYTAFFKQNDVLTVVKPGTSCSIAPLVYPLSNSVAGLDFGIYCNSAQPNIGLRLIPFGIFRPGFENLFALVIFNRGTSTESGTVALSYVDSLLQFLDASVQPISVQTGNLQWSFSNLKPYETRNIVVRFFTKTKAIPGTNFTFYAAFSPLPSDVDLNDNQETLYLRILGSFDPNDKSVLPETYHLDQFVSGMPLRYTIRFQNTGNYPADFVVVLDTLAPGLDLGTLRVVGASHPFKWSMQAPRTLQFRFDAIHLPDSASNALKSQGFVQFEIRPTNNFHVYDTVFNRASIYFDFNPPVHTNQVATVLYPSTAIYTPNGVPEALQIWPNPAQDQLHVTGEFTDKNVFIYNSFGQLMEQIQPRGSALTLEISQWNPGIYLLVCGTQHIRFIIH